MMKLYSDTFHTTFIKLGFKDIWWNFSRNTFIIYVFMQMRVESKLTGGKEGRKSANTFFSTCNQVETRKSFTHLLFWCPKNNFHFQSADVFSDWHVLKFKIHRLECGRLPEEPQPGRGRGVCWFTAHYTGLSEKVLPALWRTCSLNAGV